jgi:hypothetical protein
MPQPWMLWIKLGIIALLIAGASYGTWYNTKNHYLAIANQKQVEVDKLILKANTDNETLKTQLEEKKNESNKALDFLLNHPAPSVRVPTCTSTSQSSTSSGGPVPITGSQPASNSAQAAFDTFRQGLESDAAEWSRALNSCQVVMDWAKAQK